MKNSNVPETISLEFDGVIYEYELNTENKCPFQIGDIIKYKNQYSEEHYLITVYEGCPTGVIKTYHTWNKSDSLFKSDKKISDFSLYEKATPEDASLFKLKCLKEGLWFDKENNKWIEVKKDNFYKIKTNTIEYIGLFNYVFHTLMYTKGELIKQLNKAPSVSSGYICKIGSIENISEATTEDMHQLFDLT